jgi:hypothetical protein
VWDTVDAVGAPFHIADLINATVYAFKFPDRKLHRLVKRACHALALDDERHSFHPLVWDETEEPDATPRRIEQVWFAGAHSNVGGGYPKQGVSLVALEWMIRRAEESDLRFVAADGAGWAAHANVDDKVYDPRAGLGIFYRWKPRDVASLCETNRVPPVVHVSAIERIAHGTEDYAPGNIPMDAQIAITPTGSESEDRVARLRAEGLRRELTTTPQGRRPLLSGVRGAVRVGILSYYVYLVGFLALLCVAVAREGVRVLTDVTGAGVFRVLWHSIRYLLSEPTLLAGIAFVFALAYLLAFASDTRMTRVFSSFWFIVQPRLRKALQDARAEARRFEDLHARG